MITAEQVIGHIQDELNNMSVGYEDRTRLTIDKMRAEGEIAAIKNMAIVTGVGTLKEHGSNQAQRDAYKLKWLQDDTDYVEIASELRGLEEQLVAAKDAVSEASKRILGYSAIAELLATGNVGVAGL